MKAGNKVWFFNGEEILDIILEREDDEAVYGKYEVKTTDGGVVGRVGVRIEKPWPVFPTREALCEHYRKIFE